MGNMFLDKLEEIRMLAQDSRSITLGSQEKTFECPLCEDKEYIVEIRDGVPWMRECSCKPQRDIKRMFKDSGLTEEQQAIRLNQFKPMEKTVAMYDLVKKYILEYDQIQQVDSVSKGLALIGKVGNGKTMCMCAVANFLLSKNIPTIFVPAPDLIADLRSAQLNDSREMEDKICKLSTAQVLIMDDIAKEKTSEWVQTQYFRIIDARYRAKLTTLFTSNCSFDEIAEKLGEAVMSRLYALTRGRQVIVSAEDYRINGKERGN